MRHNTLSGSIPPLDAHHSVNGGFSLYEPLQRYPTPKKEFSEF